MAANNDIEVRGQTVDEAVESGLTQLGLDRSDVLVDIIDEGSKGILGIGSREAIVRLVPMVTRPPRPAEKPPDPNNKSKPASVSREKTTTSVSPPPARDKQRAPNKPKPPERPRPVRVELTAEEVAAEREMATDLLNQMLHTMQVEANIDVALSEPDNLTGRQINVIKITGDNLGALIGPRGETLNSLQFITRLMVGHRLQQRADFVIDIEGYRERREQALARLAERMADKVVNRDRPVILEPMPPHERRVIHMTLRDNEAVTTQSTGEGRRRRVRILPAS